MDPSDYVRRILQALDSGELTAEQISKAARSQPSGDDDLSELMTTLGLGGVGPGAAATLLKTPDPSANGRDRRGAASGNGPANGRYDIEASRHARGGIGEVWRARDRRLDRPVAIKRLRPDRISLAAIRRRFHREAQITARLQHPGVVPVFDLLPDGHEGGGGPWYTMRFVDGKTLARATREHHEANQDEASLRRLVEALVAVCQTIAYAHSAEVLHRDLKGDNVILGDFGEVFVLDWGLAKQIGTADEEVSADQDDHEPELTTPGSRLGTPAYMAPEVARGEPTTTLSDVYSLGAILYAILTGRPPYQGSTPEEVVLNVGLGPPPTPVEVNPRASRPLDAICRKAMAREPAERYQAATELADDLRRWLDDRPVSAYRDPWSVQLTRWGRKHRTAAASIAAVLAATFAVATGASILLAQANQKTEEARDETEQRFRLAHDVVGRMIVEAGQRDLPPITEVVALNRNLNRLAADLQRDLVRRKPQDRALVLETALSETRAGDSYRTAYEMDQARSYYQSAFGRLRDLLGGPPSRESETARILLASTLLDLADMEYLRGEPIRALDHLDEADRVVDPIDAHLGNDPIRLYQAGRSRLSRAATLELLGRNDEARTLIEESRDNLVRSAPRHSSSPTVLILVECHRALLRARAEPEEARAIAARTTERTASVLARQPRNGVFQQIHAIALKEQGRTLLDIGDKPAAEASLVESVAILSNLVDRSNRLPRFLDDLVEAQRYLGRCRQGEAAEADFRASIANGRELITRYPSIADFQTDLGLGLADLASRNGDETTRREARRLLDEALTRCPNNPEILAAKQALDRVEGP